MAVCKEPGCPGTWPSKRGKQWFPCYDANGVFVADPAGYTAPEFAHASRTELAIEAAQSAYPDLAEYEAAAAEIARQDHLLAIEDGIIPGP